MKFKKRKRFNLQLKIDTYVCQRVVHHVSKRLFSWTRGTVEEYDKMKGLSCIKSPKTKSTTIDTTGYTTKDRCTPRNLILINVNLF